MKTRKLLATAMILAMSFTMFTGCSRSLRDGVSIGVTDGLSGGIATVIEAFITSLNNGG